jgi:hypothetical protein
MATRTGLEDTPQQIVCKPANMEAPQMNSWNDDRLDELSARTDAGFKEVKAEIKDVRTEIHRLTNTLLAAGAVVVASIIGTGILT